MFSRLSQKIQFVCPGGRRLTQRAGVCVVFSSSNQLGIFFFKFAIAGSAETRRRPRLDKSAWEQLRMCSFQMTILQKNVSLTRCAAEPNRAVQSK